MGSYQLYTDTRSYLKGDICLISWGVTLISTVVICMLSWGGTVLSRGVKCLLFPGSCPVIHGSYLPAIPASYPVIHLSRMHGIPCGTLLSRGLSACYPRAVKLLSTVTWSYTVDYEWILCHQRGIPSRVSCFGLWLVKALSQRNYDSQVEKEI